MRNQILVPAHVANQAAIEEANRQAAEAKRNRETGIALMKERLKKEAGDPIGKDEANAYWGVYQMCSALINMNGRIVPQPNLTPREIGRLVSDVLLGDGVGYEEKT